MKTFKIKINEELSSYVERLNFEVNAKERIVKTMLSDTSYDNLMENQNFLKYQERYELAFAEYEVAKQEIENMIPKKTREEHPMEWSLDFLTRTMSITFKCDCFDRVDCSDEILKGE